MDIKEYIKNNKLIIGIGLLLIIIIAVIIPHSRNLLKYNIWDSFRIAPGYFFNAGVKYEEASIKYKKNESLKKMYLNYTIGSFKRALKVKKNLIDINLSGLHLPERQKELKYQLESLYNLGVIYYQYLKNYQQAFHYFTTYIDLFEKLNIKNPHEKDILNTISYILSLDDSSKNAKAKAMKKQGDIAVFKKDYQTALEYYKNALTMDPSFVEAYNNIAATYFYLNDFKNAVDFWKMNLLFEPKELQIYVNIALAYETELKNYREAIIYYEKYIKIARNFPGTDPDILQKISIAEKKIQMLNGLISKKKKI